ncbi:MAG: DUF1566 domain-containing protein [Chlorobiaceae bacterium]|nr:DUF1566 domain-containing protein [Chlorobiaceae bacterium]
MNKFVSGLFTKSYRSLVKYALVCTVIAPSAVSTVYAAEAQAVAPAASTLKIGENYGGGKVAYIYQVGDEGYVAGQTHGLIAAKEDLGSGASWEKAIKLCREYNGGGFTDWRLPNKVELNRLFVTRATVGGFENHHYYWSSTESDKNDAWDKSFRTGVENLGYKLDNNYVRAVRTF